MSLMEIRLDDTGQLKKIAEEKYQERNRPVDVAPIVLTAVVVLIAALWAFPALDNDRFAIDSTRWVMAAASVGSAIITTVCGVYVLDLRSRKRTDLLMTAACHNAAAIAHLAAQMEQLDAKIGTYWNGYTAGVNDVRGGVPQGKVLPFDR